MINFPVTMEGERHFHPFHLLIDSAQDTLDELREYQFGGHALALSTMLLCALAIEALANSIGSHKVAHWVDYENSSPIAKLRVIANVLNIDFKAEESPWNEARQLIKFRNRVAHAKPITTKIKKEITEENLHEIFNPAPSKIENEITYDNAEKAFKITDEIRWLLCSKLDPDKDRAFFVPS